MSSPDLFDLIRSLTPSEKRHFSLRIGDKDLHYGRLFRALLELPAYDDDALVDRLREKGAVRHLSVAKRHLYFLLLDDLLAGRRESVEEEVRKGADYVRILRARGLPRQAEKLIRRYKKKAYEYELFRPLLELIELEKQLVGSKTEEDQIEKLHREEAKCLERLANTNAYWRLVAQIGRLQWQYQKMPGEAQQKALERLYHDPLLADRARALTLQSEIYYYRARSIYFFTVGQPEQAYVLNQQLLQLLDASPAFLRQFPEVYLHTFNNFLIDSLQLRRFDALGLGLDKLSALSQRSEFRKVKDLDAQLFRQRYLLEVNWRLSAGEPVKAIALAPEVERGLRQFGPKLLKPHRVTLQYLLAYLLWLDRQYEPSSEYAHQLMQEKEDVVQEIFQFTRVLNLLLQFELGNWEHLSYLLPSTRRYLKQRRRLYRAETSLLHFLQKAINSPANQQAALKKAFALEVNELASDPAEARFFNYIDLLAWVQ